jgi:hypothetical protein
MKKYDVLIFENINIKYILGDDPRSSVLGQLDPSTCNAPWACQEP